LGSKHRLIWLRVNLGCSTGDDILLLALDVLGSVDLKHNFVLEKVVNEELSYTVNMVLSGEVELRVGCLPLANWSDVLLLVHVELVLDVNVGAEVCWEIGAVSYLDLKVKSLIDEVHRVVCEQVFVQLFAAIFVTRNNVHMNCAINHVVNSHDRNVSGVVHQVSQAFKHVKTLSKQNWLRFLGERILFLVEFLKVILLVDLQSVSHHSKFVLELVD
jgi:hypothetical protein